jgi:hypothetical protein
MATDIASAMKRAMPEIDQIVAAMAVTDPDEKFLAYGREFNSCTE